MADRSDTLSHRTGLASTQCSGPVAVHAQVAAAGTQAEQIIAFIERMRTGQLPQAEELRHQPTVDLLKGLKHGTGDSEPSVGGRD